MNRLRATPLIFFLVSELSGLAEAARGAKRLARGTDVFRGAHMTDEHGGDEQIHRQTLKKSKDEKKIEA